MKRVACAVLMLACSGCAWFVPPSVKKEAAMTRIDVQTAIDEVKALPDSDAKAKSLNSLNRVYPHMVNIENYMYGRQADRTTKAK
jgi:hypothetical protein